MTRLHTHTDILYSFVSKKTLKICFTGYGETSIYSTGLSLQHSVITFFFSCSRIFLRHANMSVVQKILLFSSKPFNFYYNCRISVAPANFHGQYSEQTRIYSLYDASTNYSGRFDSLLYRKKEQIAVSCSISIAKVVSGSTATLTML